MLVVAAAIYDAMAEMNLEFPKVDAEKRKERGIESEYTYHVYPNDKQYQMNIVSESHYQMAKLAGKPVKS